MKESLSELYASFNCGITDEGIKELKNLKKLIAWNNDKIIKYKK
jgi:hypothetical protein